MDKVKVEICCGTACYLLGAVHLMELEAQLPPEMRERVAFEAKSCLGQCENDRLGGAPFVRFNGTEMMSRATPGAVMARLRELLGLEVA
ncbi:MAG: hypothetical protein MJ240_11695 [Kiritimatiellae bacterium]|nr:hypothetical protein [Kiritimatiellia bacterium]